MLYRQSVNKLRKFLPNLRSLRRFGVWLALFLGIVLFSWVVMAQQPVTLNLLLPAPDAPPLQRMIKDFEAENPGIRINIVEGPKATNLVEDLYTSAFILGESPYDLVLMDIIWTPKFAAAGWLLNLSDRISQEELAAFSPNDVAGGRY